MRTALLPVVGGALLVLAGCGSSPAADVPDLPDLPVLAVSSSAVDDGGRLPVRYTCDGAGDFPAVSWGAVPDRTQAVAVIVYDPDASGGDYVHRIVTDLPPQPAELDTAATPTGALELATSDGTPGWTPPCPPEGDGEHRYVFAVYALNRPTRLPPDAATHTAVTTVTQSAIAVGELTATYSR